MSKRRIFILFIALGCMLLAATVYRRNNNAKRSNDFLNQVSQGDFTSLVGLSENQLIELERIYSYYQNVNEAQWIYVDINKDGISELIWQEKDAVGNSQVHRILAVFIATLEGAKCVVWDINDMGEFYFCLNENIFYFTSYLGVYDYFYYGICKCDMDGKLSVIKSFEVYDLKGLDKEDLMIFLSQFDWTQEINKTDCGDGRVYYVIGTQLDTGEGVWRLSEEDKWIEQFRSEIGIVDLGEK